MSYSIRLDNDEEKLFKSYTKIHGVSLSEALKSALIEKIENEFDLEVANIAYQEYLDSGKECRPIEELWEKID